MSVYLTPQYNSFPIHAELREIPTSDPQHHGEATPEKISSIRLHSNRKRSATADEIPSSAKRPKGIIAVLRKLDLEDLLRYSILTYH